MPTVVLRRLAVVALLAVAAAACGSDSDATTSTVDDVGASTTTTLAPATTTIATTTTTVAETTTTVAETTTTEPATTTTMAATVELSDEGIQAGSTWVYLGMNDEEAITAVAAVLGAPDEDSGWIDSFSIYGTCPSPVVRGVHWGSFVLLFTQADTDFWSGGVPHLFAYYYTSSPPDLQTTEGLRIGDTLETLESLYGGPKLEIDEDPFDPTGGIWLYDVVGWTGMWGYADGQDPTSTISTINGGVGCGE